MYNWPVIDETGLQRTRSERVHALMGSLQLDHLLLTSFDNIRYITGCDSLSWPHRDGLRWLHMDDASMAL